MTDSKYTNPLRRFIEQQENNRLKLIEEYGEDFERASSTFGLNRAEQGAVNKWVASLRAEIIAIQKGTKHVSEVQDIMASEPYYGATGGGLTYAFTPTSLGTICVVTEAITKKSLNVQEATYWYFYG